MSHDTTQQSETLANIAATIFASYIHSRQINENNEDAYLKKAVDAALKIARFADKAARGEEL